MKMSICILNLSLLSQMFTWLEKHRVDVVPDNPNLVWPIDNSVQLVNFQHLQLNLKKKKLFRYKKRKVWFKAGAYNNERKANKIKWVNENDINAIPFVVKIITGVCVCVHCIMYAAYTYHRMNKKRKDLKRMQSK